MNDHNSPPISPGSSPRHDGRGFGLVLSQQQFSLPSTTHREARRVDRTSKNKAQRSVDKENHSTSDEGWSYIGSDLEQNSLGFAADVGRDIGKEVGNMPRNLMSPQRGRKEKDRKNRRGSYLSCDILCSNHNQSSTPGVATEDHDCSPQSSRITD